MNKKINTIWFIFLLFFLICAVSASDSENETMQSIEQPDPNQDLCKLSVENINEETRLKSTSDDELSVVKVENDEKLQVSTVNELKTSSAKKKISIVAPNVNMYYKDGSKFTVTLKYKTKVISNAKVIININGKNYTKTTNTKGIATVNLNLESGTYTAVTTCYGNSEFEKASAKSTIKIKSTIKCSDFKKIYKNTSPYTATFYDKTGKVLKTTTIKFKLNSKTYSVKTDKKGVAKLNFNLNVGKYTISVINSKTSETIKKTVTVTPIIINNKDLTKYYNGNEVFKVKIITSEGKGVGSGKKVSFNVNGVTLKVTTDKTSYAQINLNLKPGTYTIKTSYGGCIVTNKLIMKTIVETSDLTKIEFDKNGFNAKILNNKGKAVADKTVTFTIGGKTYTKTTNKNGIATLDINLEAGKYTITTKYGDLSNKNKITINQAVKSDEFTHSILLPNYVNITHNYVINNVSFQNSVNGIMKLPKYDLIRVEIANKTYLLSRSSINGVDSITMGYKHYLIPFDGSDIKSDINKRNLNGYGILISPEGDYTQIDFRSKTTNNTEMFGVYANANTENSEIFTYMQNKEIIAKVIIQTYGFEEVGLKYSLSRLYNKDMYSATDYDKLTNYNSQSIRYASTNKPVTLNYFRNSITGPVPHEEIITKFTVNGTEELVKREVITYGLGENFRKTLGFEVLQTFSIINTKVTKEILENWISANSNYLNKFGIMNLYGMHLASLETVWLADELADGYAKDFNVTWKRNHSVTILGGINLDDTYLNILNADMGMDVEGSSDNVISFRFINSLQLPNLEAYSLSEVSKRFMNNTTNSQDNVLHSILNNEFSIVQLGEMMYLFSEDGSNSAIILNTTSGVASVIYSHNNETYKGASLHTSEDCCGVGIMPVDIITGIRNAFKTSSDAINNFLNKIHPLSKLAYKIMTFIAGKVVAGTTKATLGLVGVMVYLQQVGVEYRTEFINEKDWHTVMDKVTFTRAGYLQSKKVYNIPNNKGGYDYIEVKINDDLTLDRNNAVYISEGQTKNLTKNETYKYFSGETWSPINVPTKYWDDSWKGIAK